MNKNNQWFHCIKWIVASVIAMFLSPILAGVNVTESRYDSYRTGANVNETILDTSNVNANSFGLLFSFPVDGDVYAQPLYVSNLKIPDKGVHNVIYVATMNDVIYAYDADSPDGQDGGLIWVRDFRNPDKGVIPAPVPNKTAIINNNIRRNMGIEGTPLIDLSRKTLYLVSRTKESDVSVQRLHALDLATGEEKPGSPVQIEGTYRGNRFNPDFQNQRAGLAIASGQIVICWGADATEHDYPYFGWVMTYDADSLRQTGTYTTTTTINGGGIWASGRAPAVLSNTDGIDDIVLFTGNAINTLNGYNGINNFPESALRLRINPKNLANPINLVDWFTPDNWSYLDKRDLDLGGSGPVILPGTEYIVGGGKQGIMYVIDPHDMGKMQEGNPKLIQSFRAVPVLHIMGGGVVWDRTSANLPLLFYNWGESDRLRAFTFDGQKFDTKKVKVGKEYIGGHPGGILTLSSNGANRGTGIVWSWGSNKDSTLKSIKQGILRAYDAEDISHLLWDSRMNTDDDALAFAKFTPPTVANGKVYLASFSGKLLVYGLLPKQRKSRVYATIQSRIDNKVLEVPGASRSPGTRIQANTSNGQARQRWEITRLANGDRMFTTATSDLLLDDALAGSKEGINTQLWIDRTKSEIKSQTWQIIPSTDGYVKIVSRGNNRALTLSDAASDNAKWVVTQTINGQANQDWKIIKKPNAGITECNAEAIQFVSVLPRNRLLTATTNHLVQLKDPENTPAQSWKMIVRPDGHYEFHSVANDLLLTAINNDLPQSNQVQLLSADNSSAQTWKSKWIEHRYNTYSYIISGLDNLVLTVQQQNIKNNAYALSLPLDSSSVQQQWRIEDTHSIWCLD